MESEREIERDKREREYFGAQSEAALILRSCMERTIKSFSLDVLVASGSYSKDTVTAPSKISKASVKPVVKQDLVASGL